MTTEAVKGPYELSFNGLQTFGEILCELSSSPAAMLGLFQVAERKSEPKILV